MVGYPYIRPETRRQVSPWGRKLRHIRRRYSIDMDGVLVRAAEPQDVQNIAKMFHALWPGASVEEHAREVRSLLSTRVSGGLPAEILLAEHGQGDAIGFLEVGMRSHADGCDPKHRVGYIEGWYVTPALRRRRIGARLVAAAEHWARSKGCVEMASDTWLNNLESQSAHNALGYCQVWRRD